jgi:hypothetical protein
MQAAAHDYGDDAATDDAKGGDPVRQIGFEGCVR